MDEERISIRYKALAIRWAMPILTEYFGFGYNHIDDDICRNLTGDDFKHYKTYTETKNIDHLPDDFIIPLTVDDFDGLQRLWDKYEADPALQLILALLFACVHNISHVPLEGFDYEDKCKLYEFLSDHSYNGVRAEKTRMEIRYGLDAKIVVENYDNWLHRLIKNALHQDLTFGGMFEYKRLGQKPQKPSRAPSLGNFVAYNTYLMFRDNLAAQSKYPALYTRIIIDLCELCKLELTEPQKTVEGMEDLLKSADRRYQGKPMPLSRVNLTVSYTTGVY